MLEPATAPQAESPLPLRNELVDPAALSEDAREALVDALFVAHEQIFAGVSREDFAAYVVHSAAERTRIQVMRAGERVVGYMAVHTFVFEIDGEQYVVLRAENGKLPAYRRSPNGNLLAVEVARACLRYPFARKGFLACPVHPAAYLALARVAPEVYPHPERPTPRAVETIMARLGRHFHMQPVSPPRPGVREVGWITREGEADRLRWTLRRDSLTEFYLRRNPHYGRGQGLMTFAPVGPGRLVVGVLSLIRRYIERRTARLRQLAPEPRSLPGLREPDTASAEI